MKKALGILLALTLAVGAFAGLSLLSVSAATSQTTIVDGEYLYDDFEEEMRILFRSPAVRWNLSARLTAHPFAAVILR